MKKAIVKKQMIVNDLVKRINNCTAMLVVEYFKLNVNSLNHLRNNLQEQDITFKVFKNRLVRLATKKTNYAALDACLQKQNAFVFTDNDPLIAVKTIAKFAKDHKTLILKGAIYNQVVLNHQQINEIALLPAKDELIVMFARTLKYPLQSLTITLDQILQKKQTAGAVRTPLH